MTIPISDVKQRLGQQHIRVIETWLDGCINYFISEDINIRIHDLLEKVKEQWSLGDLVDIGIPCLPTNITSADPQSRLKTLNGRFVLQMQYIIDISESAYNQLEKLNNITRQSLENEKTVEKASRMLKMELTDGQITVVAVEYRIIPELKLNLKPGIKIMLIGPIRVGANGTLFLESRNVSVIGGEVDSLIEINCQENVLLRSLGLPEKKGLLFGDRTALHGSTIRDAEPITPAPVIRQHEPRNEDAMPLLFTFNQSQADLVMDDDLLLDNEFLDDLEKNFYEPFEENAESGTSASDIERRNENEGIEEDFMEHDDLDDLLMQVDENLLSACDNEDSTSSFVGNRISNRQKISNMFASTSVKSKQVSAPAIVARIKKNITDIDYPIKVDEIPLAYIKQLNCVKSELNSSETFAVFAEVIEVTSKLCLKNDAWNLTVIITDRISRSAGRGSKEDDLNIVVSSNVLEELIGLSVEEMKELSKRIPQDPGIKRDILEKLTFVKEKFEKDLFLFHVRLSKDKLPTVVDMKSQTNIHKSIITTKRQYD